MLPVVIIFNGSYPGFFPCLPEIHFDHGKYFDLYIASPNGRTWTSIQFIPRLFTLFYCLCKILFKCCGISLFILCSVSSIIIRVRSQTKMPCTHLCLCCCLFCLSVRSFCSIYRHTAKCVLAQAEGRSAALCRNNLTFLH